MTRRVAALPVAWVAGIAFLALFAALALQLRHGRDPALGAGPRRRGARRGRSAPGALRRIVVRRVIVRVIPAASAPAPSAPVTAGAPPTATCRRPRPHRWSRARPLQRRLRLPPPLPRHLRQRGPPDGARARHDVQVDGQRRAAADRASRDPASYRPRRRRASRTRDYIEYFARCLTRFDPSSELCALNRDAASGGAGLAPAARRRDGRPVRRAPKRRARRSDADPAARARRVRELARGRPSRSHWRRRSRRRRRGGRRQPDPRARVARDRGGRRAPGWCAARRALRFDTGGTGKGLAADAVAHRLAGYPRLRRRLRRRHRPCAARWEIEVEHPLTGECVHTLRSARRRRRDVRPQRAGLAARGRQLRAPSARPVDRRAGVDGPDRRHRARANRARGRDAVEARVAVGSRRRADRARRTRRDRRARRRRRRADRTGTACAAAAHLGPGAGGMTGPDPANYVWWLAGPRVRRRGAAARDGIRRARPHDGVEGRPQARRRRRCSRACTSRRRWPGWSRSPCTASRCSPTPGCTRRVGRARALHHGLPAAVHRARHRRRLPGGPARPQLLRAPAHRRAAVAQAPSRDRARLGARRGARARRRHRRRRRRGCAAFMLATGVPIVVLFAIRMLRRPRPRRARSPRRPRSQEARA